MIRKFLFILIFVLFFLTGCAKNNNIEQLTFSSWGSVSEVKIIKKAITEFESENPNIKITFIHIPQNYFQKLQLLFASNTEPDVLFINNLYLPVYAARLEDLTNIIDSTQFYPQAVQSLTFNNKLLAIPRDISSLVLYINLDKGKLPDKSWTIEDMINLAAEYKEKGLFGISFEEKSLYLYPYLRYFGGEILDCKGKYVYNSEKSQKGVEFYKNLRTKFNVAPTKSEIGSSTLAQMFIEGKLGMYLSGRWMFPKISELAKFNWAVVNFPIGEKPLPCDASGWAISKNSKHKASALKFIKFMSDEKRSKYFTQTGLITPARINSSKLLMNNNHNEQVFVEVIEKSQHTFINKDYQKLTDKIEHSLE